MYSSLDISSVQKRKHKPCLYLFYVSSSIIIIIFIFYYRPFLSSFMDSSCIDPVPIILILTMILCDSFYNSILTKDWGDAWRGLKSLR